MKNVRIFIVFERQDFEVIKNLVTNNDFIFGDFDLKKLDDIDSSLVKRQALPHLTQEELNHICGITRDFFVNKLEKIDEDLLGFINNYFEATLVPVLSYIFALDNLIKSIEAPDISISIVFSHEIKHAKCSSFFLAEHEAQLIFLYDRACVFQPYLLDKFSSKYEILYLKTNRLGLQVLSNARQVIRLWGVFLVRLGFSISRNFLVPYTSGKFNTSLNTLVITRTPNKSEFIDNLFTGFNDSVGICVGENFGRISRNYRFCKNTLRLNYSSILQMQLPSVFIVFKEYYRAAIKISSQKKISLSINGCDIDLTQSLREMLALLPDLKIYMLSLESMISSLDNLSLLISTELKSPYAYGDSKVSIRNKFKCIHIQDCDYLPSPIPMPIFGNALVIRDPGSIALYKSAWTKCGASKVFALQKRLDQQLSGSKNSSKLIWCFFTSAVTKNDRLAIERLCEINKSYGVDFIVKLHPRDSIMKYLRYWRRFKFYRDGDISKKNLFSIFNAALTFSSAVINDLEESEIPYLLVNIDPISHFNISAHCKMSDRQEINSFNHFIDKFMWANQNFSKFKAIFDFEKEIHKNNKPSVSILEELENVTNFK